MMFDNLKATEAELIGHVQAACAALQFLRDVDPGDTIDPGPLHDQWVQHMMQLGEARIQFKQAAEALHDELNEHNDAVIAAAATEPLDDNFLDEDDDNDYGW